MSIARDPLALLLGQVTPVLQRFLDRSGASRGDFAKVEEAGRTAILALREVLMSAGLAASVASAPDAFRCPDCGTRLSAYGSGVRHVVTAEGEARVRSARYRCPRCEQDHYPLEAANGLSDGHYTTGAKGVIAATASEMPYEPAAQVLAGRGVSVSAKEVDRKVAEVSGWREAEEKAAVKQLGASVRAQRVRRVGRTRQKRAQTTDRTRPSVEGVFPPSPLHNWSGWRKEMAAVVSVDGGKVRSPVVGPQGLEWFEARMGVIAPVVAQPVPSPEALAEIAAAGAWPPAHPPGQPTPKGRENPPRRRSRGRRHRCVPASPRPFTKPSTLYLAGPTGLAGPPEINALFHLLAAARLSDPHPNRLLLFIADGADWIWWRVSLFFPMAVQVVDIYHAAEHVASAALACWGEASPQAKYWGERARTMLLAPGGPQRIRQILRHELEHGRPEDPDELRKNLAYLEEHKERMPYAQLYAKGLPVGSGAMESAVKQMSTQRLRQPGMMWSRRGAERMLRIRAAHLSGNLTHTVQRQHARLQSAAAVYALRN